MPTEHTYKQFDAELEAVRANVLKMGGLVEEQITNAIEALVQGNMKLAFLVSGATWTSMTVAGTRPSSMAA